jgi:hypothetical protein
VDIQVNSRKILQVDSSGPGHVDVWGLFPWPMPDDLDSAFAWLLFHDLVGNAGCVWHLYDYLPKSIKQRWNFQFSRMYLQNPGAEKPERESKIIPIAMWASEFHPNPEATGRAGFEDFEMDMREEDLRQIISDDGFGVYARPKSEFVNSAKALVHEAVIWGTGIYIAPNNPSPWEEIALKHFNLLASVNDDGNCADIRFDLSLADEVQSAIQKTAEAIYTHTSVDDAWCWSEAEMKFVDPVRAEMPFSPET